jgi:predicted nucleotidyltransferase
MPVRETIADVLGQRDDIRLAILFGSHAAGGTTALSDVDVAVLFERDPDLLAAGSVVSRLESALASKVDLVVLNGLPARSPALAYRIAMQGVPVVARDRSVLVAFKTAACLHYFDTARLRAETRQRLLERIGQGKTGMRDYV